MNKKPTLVIMAAGMGSRYGGLKQMDPVGPSGELIIDYSLYDAMRAGFEKAVFIIKKEMLEDMEKIILTGAGKKIETAFAFQDAKDLPGGLSVPEGRVKPWGTAHAVWCARDLIDGSFAVINADDFYGRATFKVVCDHLAEAEDKETFDYCMAVYSIENTLSESGKVTRGICSVGEDGFLERIDERMNVYKDGDLIRFEDDKGNPGEAAAGTPVSMNFFGYTKSMMRELDSRMHDEIKKIIEENPLKGEFYIPILTSDLVREGKAKVKALPTAEKWHGVTYQEDRISVKEALLRMRNEGAYPEKLWD